MTQLKPTEKIQLENSAEKITSQKTQLKIKEN